jgi:hypothetical protein
VTPEGRAGGSLMGRGVPVTHIDEHGDLVKNAQIDARLLGVVELRRGVARPLASRLPAA